MKQSRFIVAALSMSCITTLSSCFKEEPLNAECDIEQAYIHADNKNLLNLLFTNPSDTLVNVQSDQTNIEFTMRPFANLKSRRLCFDLLKVPQFSRKAEAYTIFQRSSYIRGYIGKQVLEPHLSGKHQEGTAPDAKRDRIRI